MVKNCVRNRSRPSFCDDPWENYVHHNRVDRILGHVKFTPSVHCVTPEGEKPEIAPCVTEIPAYALCAAAGNYRRRNRNFLTLNMERISLGNPRVLNGRDMDELRFCMTTRSIHVCAAMSRSCKPHELKKTLLKATDAMPCRCTRWYHFLGRMYYAAFTA